MQPALLVQDGLGPALEVVAERVGVRVRLDVAPRRFSREIESTLYSVLCETLSYAVDRAHATQVHVRVGHEDGLAAELTWTARAPATPPPTSPGCPAGSELRGQMDVGGGPGEGTRVRMDLPCE